MLLIKSKDLFEGKEILTIFSKFTISGAIIKENI